MGLFVFNMEPEGQETVESLVKVALVNLDLYSDYCDGSFKDSIGQTPPDYLVKDLAMKYLKQALEILEKANEH